MDDVTRNRSQALGLALQVLRHRPGGAAAEHAEPAKWLAQSVAEIEADSTDKAAAGRAGFVPRDSQMSLLQATYDERAAQGSGSAPVGSGGPPTGFLARLADQLLSWLPGGLYKRFSDGFHLSQGIDPEWVKAYYELAFEHGQARESFTLPPGGPAPRDLAPDARVILVSDWGTGEEFADAVARQVERAVAEAGGRETHVVHLGDVYYAGTTWEAQHRFLDHWPVKSGASTSSWCLNGNHDMYAAGTGLFQTILTDARFERQKTVHDAPTSELHLRGEHWQIIGVDTAWTFTPDDVGGAKGRLGEDQQRWLQEKVPAGGSPRTILLSHHPGFHNDEHGVAQETGNMQAATAALRTGGRRIHAWFWGHEHRLITYDTPAELGIDYAACVGHGAIPETPDPDADSKAPANEHRYTETVTEDGDTWYRCGFTILDFDDDTVEVSYVDLTGDRWAAGATRLPVRP